MKNLNLASLINLLLLFCGLFIALLICVSLFNIPLAVRLILALTTALGITYFAYKRECLVCAKKHRVKMAKTRLNQCMHILNTCAIGEISPVFLELFSQNNICAEVHNRYITTNGGFCIFLGLFVEPLTEFTLKNIIETSPFANQKHVVISNGFSLEAINYAKARQITLVKTEEIIPLLNFDLFLTAENHEQSRTPLSSKIPFKDIIIKAYARKNFKRYFVYGVIMYLMSTISFYPVYYIISGGFFIVNGLIALLFGKTEQDAQNQTDRFLSILSMAEE